MLYLLVWTVVDHKKSIPKFGQGGVAAPKGVTVLQDYHAVGQPRGFTVVQTDDLNALHTFGVHWADSVRIDEVVPVIPGEESRAALSPAVLK